MKFKLRFVEGTFMGFLQGITGTHVFESDSLTPEQVKVLIGTPTEDDIINIFNPRLKELREENIKTQELVDVLLDSGLFEEKDGAYYRVGNPISVPRTLLQRYKKAIESNNYDEFDALDAFWLKCSLNPNKEARENTHWFLEKYGFSIVNSGDILAYRNVNVKQQGNKELHDFVAKSYTKVKTVWKKSPKNYYVYETNGEFDVDNLNGNTTLGNLQELYDNLSELCCTIYTDQYTGKFNIQIGEPVSMPREDCDETQSSCSRGLHLAGASWLKQGYFGQEGLICLVNPANIVSVPTVDDYGKLRCCSYMPIGVAEYDGEGNIIPIDSSSYEVEYDQHFIEELNRLLQEIDPSNQVVHKLTFEELPNQVYTSIDTYRGILEKKNINLYQSEFDFEEDDYDDYDDEDWDDDYDDEFGH